MECKLPFEYGFKERARQAKLKGGKPKVQRIQKEKNLINLGTTLKKEEAPEIIKVEIKEETVAKVSLD